MADTFDAVATGSGAECVRHLKGLDLIISQRLGARLVALGRRGIRCTLAVLETASPGSRLEQKLLDPAWQGADLQTARYLLREFPELTVTGDLAIVTADEVEDAASSSGSSLVPLVAGTSVPSTPLFERNRLEEAALTFLDSEDMPRVLETFRYLLRALLTTGQDPASLLASAFRRGKPELSREAARLIREQISGRVGEGLADLLSDRPTRIQQGLEALLDDRDHAALVAAVLPPLLLGADNRMELTRLALPQLARFRWPDATTLEAFLDRLLADAVELDAGDRHLLGSFLVELAGTWVSLGGWLADRLRATRDPHLRAFYGSVLCRLTLPQRLHDELTRLLVDTFLEHPQDVGLHERMRLTLLRLGPRPLEVLSEHELGPPVCAWVLTLWHQALTEGHPHPGEDVFGRMAARELLACNRSALMELARRNLLGHPALQPHLAADLDAIGRWLSDEVGSMEDPDDLVVLEFLARLSFDFVETFFARLREDAVLEARTTPWRLRLFARLARLAVDHQERVAEMVEVALSLPCVCKPSLPHAVEGLIALACIPGPHQEQASHLLLDELEPFAPLRIEGAAAVYLAVPAVRPLLESRIFDLLGSDAMPRAQLQAALAAVERMLDAPEMPAAVEELAAGLSRRVLQRSRGTSLQVVLEQALQEDGDGSGVVEPVAWDKEDQDTALRILGKIAGHPGVPEDLSRRLVARLVSFLDDWLDAHERGRDLYFNRATPLWDVLATLLAGRPTEMLLEQADRIGLRLLEIHRRVPQRLALDRREDVQRYITRYVALGRSAEVTVRGVRMDVPRGLLQVLTDLAAADVGTARWLLRELK
ncbi:MAG: hypothetical protein ACYCW6_28125 [Candidatus Xenobia bacterium]